MKIAKISLIIFIFVIISMYWSAATTSASAEENKLIAQVGKPGKTVTPIRPKVDCKWTEEKDKDGKIIYKLTGKDCQKMEQELNSQQKAVAGTCCVCERTTYGVIVCRGSCCLAAFPKALNALGQ